MKSLWVQGGVFGVWDGVFCVWGGVFGTQECHCVVVLLIIKTLPLLMNYFYIMRLNFAQSSPFLISSGGVGDIGSAKQLFCKIIHSLCFV